MSHKYSVGQAIVFSPGARDIAHTGASGTITRLLPKDGAEYQYHIELRPDGQQRRVHEDQLRPVVEAATGWPK